MPFNATSRNGTLVVVLVLGVPCLYAQETDPVELVVALTEALNAGDIDAALGYLSEDAVITMAPTG